MVRRAGKMHAPWDVRKLVGNVIHCGSAYVTEGVATTRTKDADVVDSLVVRTEEDVVKRIWKLRWLPPHRLPTRVVSTFHSAGIGTY